MKEVIQENKQTRVLAQSSLHHLSWFSSILFVLRMLQSWCGSNQFHSAQRCYLLQTSGKQLLSAKLTKSSGEKIEVHIAFSSSLSRVGGVSLLLVQRNVADVYGVCRSGESSLSQIAMVGCSPFTREEGISIKINSSSLGGELSKQGEVVPLQLVAFGNPLLMLELQAP